MLRNALNKRISVKTPMQKAQKQLLSIMLAEDDTAIDCGASVGSITAHLCKSVATVYSFEPNPHAFEMLQSKFTSV